MIGRRWHLAVGSALIIGLLLGFLRATAPPAAQPEATQDVQVIGDSLSVDSRPYLSPTWGSRAKDDRALWTAQTLISDVAANLDPDVLVLALGSNDVAHRRRSMARAIRTSNRNTAGVGCVIFTTVKVDGVTPFYNRQWRRFALRFNNALWSSDAQVANWNKEATDHPAYFVSDGLHMNTVGQMAYARFLQQSVTNLCRVT